MKVMNLKFIKIKTINPNFLEELPCFYKYVVAGYAPAIPASAMLERVFMRWNKEYNLYSEFDKFLLDVMPSLSKPGSNLIFYYMLLCVIYFKNFGKKRGIFFFYKYHTVVFDKMMVKGGN